MTLPVVETRILKWLALKKGGTSLIHLVDSACWNMLALYLLRDSYYVSLVITSLRVAILVNNL